MNDEKQFGTSSTLWGGNRPRIAVIELGITQEAKLGGGGV